MIAPHLPRLRGFSRALVGSQVAGDAYVAAALETLLADPALLDEDLDPRVALYKLFIDYWSSVKRDESASKEGATAHERHLAALSPQSREAFLLSKVEGFEDDEVAIIMGVDRATADDWLEQAAAELAEQVATDVLIIEDEPMIAIDLENIVSDLGHRVTAIARTHREALEATNIDAPGLILADIQLADESSGLEAVKEILEHVSAPVIFITAYPERLLTGERPEPTFLIAKPFQEDTVKALVSRALFFDKRPRSTGSSHAEDGRAEQAQNSC